MENYINIIIKNDIVIKRIIDYCKNEIVGGLLAVKNTPEIEIEIKTRINSAKAIMKIINDIKI